MNYATKSMYKQVLVWLIWAMTCVVFLSMSDKRPVEQQTSVEGAALAVSVVGEQNNGAAYPWGVRRRLRKWAWRRYRELQRAHQRAQWVARVARLALCGALTFAQLVDVVTQSQLRRKMGALPVLYALLETLQVRQIINRYCRGRGQVDQGSIALVLVLNRLMMPLPLYQVSDWLAQTMLVSILGISAAKFNDDRLGRTLTAISPHVEDIWQAVIQRALVQAQVDLRLIFYDLSAFIAHGAYSSSQLIDFGFAHNTPMSKRKFKAGLDVSADGNLPIAYDLWSGRTADMATVEANLERLTRLLGRAGWVSEGVLVVGDRANLSDELVFAYEDHHLRYLAGLRILKTVHRDLVLDVPEMHFYSQPLTDSLGPSGYWGVPCRVPFEHAGRKASHRGLIVLSGPMRTALRQSRAVQLKELRQALKQLQTQIGQPRLRSPKTVQRRANKLIHNSPAGKFMRTKAELDPQGQVCLRWWLDTFILFQTMQHDGRYLLVTNDWSLSPRQMFARYHQKDGVEKCFHISKHDLKVSPIYLHKDDRITAMLLINLLALLAYRLLERQALQSGLHLTTRRIIAKLESLDVVETICYDGSRLFRTLPADAEQIALLHFLAHLLADLRFPRWSHPFLSGPNSICLALAPPPPHPSLA